MQCEAGKLQWRSLQLNCVECPPEGVDCNEPSAVNVVPGFYRSEEWWQPSQCPAPRSCLGGNATGDASCADGCAGIFCSQCKRGWHRHLSGCRRCSDVATGGTLFDLLFLILALTAGVFGLSRYLRSYVPSHVFAASAGDGGEGGVADESKEGGDTSVIDTSARRGPCVRRLLGAATRAYALGGRLSTYLPPSASRQGMTIAKIIISYMQIADAFALFQNVRWPHAFTSFLQAIDLSRIVGVQVWIGDLMMPAECAMRVSLGEHTRLLLTLLLPLLFSAAMLGLAAFVAVRAFRRQQQQEGEASAASTPPAESGAVRRILTALCASPAFYNIHIWMLLILYPTICRTTLAAFECVPLQLGPSHSDVTYLLRRDPLIKCYTASWVAWALLASLGIVVYCLGVPTAFLRLTAQHRKTPQGRARVGILLNSYTPECWYFESIEMLRKLLLTSVVLTVDPNSKVQLWFGSVMSIAFAALTFTLRPYRDLLPGMVQAATQLQILFNYASAFVFFTDESVAWRVTPPSAATNSSFGVILVLCNIGGFVLVTISVLVSMRAQHRVLGELRVTDAAGKPVAVLPPAHRGGDHLFLSHAWQYGQDQCGTIKGSLQALLPALRCFLDVDSLEDMTQLEKHVQASDIVLVMLTKGYLSSRSCRRELVEARRQKKPLIVLRESDPRHGATSLSDLSEDASLVPLEEERAAAEALVRILDEGEGLEWHREGHLKRAALGAVLQKILDLQAGVGPKQERTSAGVCISHAADSASSRWPSRREGGALTAAGGGSRVTVAGGAASAQKTRRRHVRLHLGSEYEAACPALCAQLRSAFEGAGAEFVGDEADGAMPLLVLCPEALRDAALRARLISDAAAGWTTSRRQGRSASCYARAFAKERWSLRPFVHRW